MKLEYDFELDERFLAALEQIERGEYAFPDIPDAVALWAHSRESCEGFISLTVDVDGVRWDTHLDMEYSAHRVGNILEFRCPCFGTAAESFGVRFDEEVGGWVGEDVDGVFGSVSAAIEAVWPHCDVDMSETYEEGVAAIEKSALVLLAEIREMERWRDDTKMKNFEWTQELKKDLAEAYLSALGGVQVRPGSSLALYARYTDQRCAEVDSFFVSTSGYYDTSTDIGEIEIIDTCSFGDGWDDTPEEDRVSAMLECLQSWRTFDKIGEILSEL